VASTIPKPPASITVSITSAPARIRSPRANLMPGTFARSSAVIEANVSISSASASRVTRKPWMP
jgi:hypothetical protein